MEAAEDGHEQRFTIGNLTETGLLLLVITLKLEVLQSKTAEIVLQPLLQINQESEH